MNEIITFMQISDKKIKTIGDKIGIDWSKINFDQFKKGLVLELGEHGYSDKQTDVIHHSLIKAGKIALAHLKELPDYYTRLNKMEMKETVEKTPITKNTITPTMLYKLGASNGVDLSNYDTNEIENGIIKELEAMQTYTAQTLSPEKLNKAFIIAFNNIEQNPSHYSNNPPLVVKQDPFNINSSFKENKLSLSKVYLSEKLAARSFKEAFKLTNVYKNDIITEKRFFDLKTWKSMPPVKQVLFLKQKGNLIGEGSSRIVYLIDGKTVVKLARNEKGLAQNKAELDASKDPITKGLITKIYDHSPDYRWLISELAKPFNNEEEFEKLTGFSFDSFLDDFDDNLAQPNGFFKSSDEHVDTNKIENPLVGKVIDLVQNKEFMPGDLQKLSSWGKTADGRLVLLDYGFNQEVAKKHYKHSMPKKQKLDSEQQTMKPDGNTSSEIDSQKNTNKLAVQQ